MENSTNTIGATLDAATVGMLDRLEQAFDRGEPWKYGDPMPVAMPNPLIGVATGISSGIVNGEEVQFLNLIDRNGKKWSRLIGAQILKDRLIEGIESRWDDQTNCYVETGRIGSVRPGEAVSILFKGYKLNPKGQRYPNFRVDRVSPNASAPTPADAGAGDDEIPF